MLDDSTSWVIYHAYSKGNFEWHGIGRQGMLSQVRYNAQDKPEADYPSNDHKIAPDLPSSGIPWMVPKSDFFDSEKLNPEWSFLGYTPDESHSLTERPGWFRLSSKGKENTIIKNDAEHNYSLITRLDFNAASVDDQAGFWIFNGLQILFAKLYSTVNSAGTKVISFSFDKNYYETENTADDLLWLKLFRENHILTGYFSSDGVVWTQVGQGIDVSNMDKNQPNYNAFTGSRQGLYVKGRSADFDLYIYRDAYSPILAEPPANQFGTLRPTRGPTIGYLDSLHHNDWAMYAGVEFGGADYPKIPILLEMIASSATTGGVVEVWLDSIDTGDKIAECNISNTCDWKTFKTFTASVEPVSGRHDVYLKFMGKGTNRLFQLKWLRFLTEADTVTGVEQLSSCQIPVEYGIEQNFPNPFNQSTMISYAIPTPALVTLKIYDLLGREIQTLINEFQQPHTYNINFDASKLSSGIYFYRLQAGNAFVATKKMLLLR